MQPRLNLASPFPFENLKHLVRSSPHHRLPPHGHRRRRVHQTTRPATVQRQHYVPKWFFRLFNDRGDAIYRLPKDTGSAIRAPVGIKGQCFEWMLYGSEEVEASLGQLDAKHDMAIRSLTTLAGDTLCTEVPGQPQAAIAEFALLMRLRHPQRAKMHLDAFAAMEAIAAHSENRPAGTAEGSHLSGGQHTKEEAVVQILMQVAHALTTSLALSDLQCLILVNRTDVPFLFGDNPVVLCNPYLQHIDYYGVLGWQTPGLQVHIPIGPKHHLVLCDPAAYELPRHRGCVVDVEHGGDVAQLNALQMHNAIDALYFHDLTYAESYERLLAVHRKEMRSAGVVVKTAPLVCQGDPGDESRQVVCMFEPHLGLKLNLACIRPVARRPQLPSNAVRSPRLARQLDEMGSHTSLSSLLAMLRSHSEQKDDGLPQGT